MLCDARYTHSNYNDFEERDITARIVTWNINMNKSRSHKIIAFSLRFLLFTGSLDRKRGKRVALLSGVIEHHTIAH